VKGAAAAGWVLVLAAACSPTSVQTFEGPTMGSWYRVKYVGDAPVGAIRALVEEELAAADAAFSLWRGDSEIAAFNRHRSTEPFTPTQRFLDVVARAMQLAERTDGAFDPTVRPLTALFQEAKEEGVVDEVRLARAKSLVGYRRLRVEQGRIAKEHPELELDLDGVVAGACADGIAARLQAAGVSSFMVEITGEVVCRGEKAPGQPWTIGIEDPAGADGAPIVEVRLTDGAVATSGTYRNKVGEGAARWHHVFDPRSGTSAASGVVSVSVRARTCAVADGLATALLVLGPDAAEAVASRWPDEDLGALFVSMEEGGRRTTRELRWRR
jgi:thiamine biosynthesis lipoprotein